MSEYSKTLEIYRDSVVKQEATPAPKIRWRYPTRNPAMAGTADQHRNVNCPLDRYFEATGRVPSTRQRQQAAERSTPPVLVLNWNDLNTHIKAQMLTYGEA